MLAFANHSGVIDLHTKSSGPDLMYVTLPLVKLVTYPYWVMSILDGLAILSLLGFAIIGWRREQFSVGRFALSVLGLIVGIALFVVLAQIAWGIILKKYTAGVASEVGFESSALWLSILMILASFPVIFILSLLDRKLGAINLTVAAPIIFLIVGIAFYFLDDTNPLTVGWFAWSLIGCVAGLGVLFFTKRPAWKVGLILCSTFLMLTIAGPSLMLATYTREDAWLPVLVVSAWVCLFAPQVDSIVGQGLHHDISSLS
jgi:hypothetical protein